MGISTIPKMYKMIGAAVALSVITVPVIVQADSSNPVYTPKKKKAAMKPRAKKKAMARRPMAKPAMPPMVEERVESIAPPAPQPQYVPPPEPAYVPPAPEPVAPPPPAPPAPVAKSGASGLLVALLAAAAVGGGVLLATGGDDNPSSGG